MLNSFRARLTLWQLAILGLTLGVFSFLLYVVLARSLGHHHDDELAAQAEAVAAHLDHQAITDDAVLSALAALRVGSRFVMIRGHEGDLRFRDPALQLYEPNIGRHAALTHAATARPSKPEFFTVALERSGEVRFVCVPLRQSDLYLQIGDPIGDVRTTLNTLRQTSLALIPIVLVISSLGGWFIATRALKPVREVAATLDDITARDLTRRVQIRPADTELTGLIATLNRLLDRLQRAFDSLRQFAGDVSHQVQTPLTVMKSTLEAARSRPVAEDRVLAMLGEQVDELSTTVRDLRAFAVADAPVAKVEAIDFSSVTHDAADIVAALGEMKGVSVTCAIAPDVHVFGEATRLKQVILNLGDNAVKYTPPGGRVSIALRKTATDAVLETSDTGVGIPAEHQPRLFDRLYRASPRTSSGSGLGLAIAKRILEAHRGSIVVRSEPGKGADFTVSLPLARPSND